MRRIKRLIAVAIPVASVVGVLAPTPAQATTVVAGAAVATGEGSITPGLTTSPTSQAVTFEGDVRGELQVTSATPTTQGTIAYDVHCQFQGASNQAETVAEGSGTVTGSCRGTGAAAGVINGTAAAGPATITVTCSLKYYRVLLQVVVAGRCTATATVTPLVGGPITVSQTFCVAGEFEFVPTSANPTQSYVLAGAVEALPPPGKTPSTPNTHFGCPALQKVVI